MDSLPANADTAKARELNRALDAGVIDREEFLAGVEEATGVRPPEIERMFRGEVVKNVPLLHFIRDIKPNYAIGLLSNISSNWIREEFLTGAEQELFDTMLFSYEVGMVKPDPRIFMLACERLRVGPHEAIMVDDVESYVAAAEQEGLAGIVYDDLGTFKQNFALLTQSTPTQT